MMRIRQSDFNASSTLPVVAIVAKNFRGFTIDSVVIRVNNFRDVSNNYSGNYISKYTFLQNVDSLIAQGSLDSNSTISGLNYGYGGNSGVNGFERYNVNQYKVDFRVYWFVEVDVWFDKMTVDDKFANHLFDGTYDIKIKEETTHESFAELIFFMKKNNAIQPSNYFTLNYVLYKMENILSEKNIVQAK